MTSSCSGWIRPFMSAVYLSSVSGFTPGESVSTSSQIGQIRPTELTISTSYEDPVSVLIEATVHSDAWSGDTTEIQGSLIGDLTFDSDAAFANGDGEQNEMDSALADFRVPAGQYVVSVRKQPIDKDQLRRAEIEVEEILSRGEIPSETLILEHIRVDLWLGTIGLNPVSAAAELD